jgi:hypothetical protein
MLSLEKKIISIWVKSHGLFENVMVETGVANGMEITSWIVQKKSLLRGLMLTVNTYSVKEVILWQG